MKKKLIASIAAVCALAVLVIGSTFAFFTSKDSAKNTFTMGDLTIKVTEKQDENKGKTGTETKDGIEYTDGLPGDTFSKQPIVTNEGSADAWIRVKIDVACTNGDITAEQMAALKAAIIEDMCTNYGWAQKDGDTEYVYYTEKMAKGDEATLFETVKIPNTWGNEAANASFTISIDAQGVQANNNGETWADADWSADVANFN